MKNTILAGLTILAAVTSIASLAEARDVLDQKCREFRPSFGINKRQIERPEPPLCATMGLPFDEYSFQSCRMEMEDYRRKVDDFTDCLGAENERAVDEFNEAVRMFNLKASR